MSSPLDLLLADGVIDAVLGRLKSGKEADISLVSQRGVVLAAKVYKERATRSFKNNAEYKEGRKTRNTRTQRAMDRGGKFGRAAAEQTWKATESTAMSRLATQGVRVPHPVIFYEGVLVMELVLGDDGNPAPRLVDVALDPAAAAKVYLDLRRQIIAMLCCDLVHGDLSPYNILAGALGPTIIDFPQVISAAHNSRAQFFFLRDFDNVLRYVRGFDASLDRYAGDGHAIWRAYTGRFLTPDFDPPPMPPPSLRPPRARRAPPGLGADRGHGADRGRPPTADRGRPPTADRGRPPSADRGRPPTAERGSSFDGPPPSPPRGPRPAPPMISADRPRSNGPRKRRPRRRG